MFRPDLAEHYEVFLIETWDVLEAVDYKAPEGKKKRDRYSYDDLKGSRDALMEKAEAYGKIDAKNRDAVQSGIVAVAHNIRTFEQLVEMTWGARFEASLEKIPSVKPVFAPATTVRGSDVLAKLPELRVRGGAKDDPRVREAGLLLAGLADEFGRGDLFALFPPEGARADEAAWFTPASLLEAAVKGGGLDPALLVELRQIEDAVRAADADDMSAFQRAFDDFQARTTARAKARGEYDKVGLEVFLLRLDPFYWAKILYLVAFLLVATSWMWRNRLVTGSAWLLLLAGLALHVTGITIRCILRGRPPVTTLYETTLFISAFGVAGGLVLERIQRRGVGIAIAPILGALGLFIANRYETITGDDTDAPARRRARHELLALDARDLRHDRLRGVAPRGGDRPRPRRLPRLRLAEGRRGVHARGREGDLRRARFALVFSTVGTILGGVWANDSWGRFWGWDPKENGALMIVLSPARRAARAHGGAPEAARRLDRHDRDRLHRRVLVVGREPARHRHAQLRVHGRAVVRAPGVLGHRDPGHGRWPLRPPSR